MKTIANRVAALEQVLPPAIPRLHCIRRYEDESVGVAIAAYESEHGPAGGGKSVMRVVISKPQHRALITTNTGRHAAGGCPRS